MSWDLGDIEGSPWKELARRSAPRMQCTGEDRSFAAVAGEYLRPSSLEPTRATAMDDRMIVNVLADANAVAKEAAAFIALQARMTARAERPFCLAVSGGSTPWTMLRMLASEDVPWHRVHLFQVDERIVPAFDPARNFTKIQSNLLESVPIPANQIHPMPVEIPDLNTAAATYAETLRQFAGTPPILDLVHLGLGADGHTASLVPGDPVLGCTSDVAVTNPYHGYRRMTLTYPVFDHARRILWIVTGSEKANALEQLRHGDQTIPASRIPTNNALVLADADAAGQLH